MSVLVVGSPLPDVVLHGPRGPERLGDRRGRIIVVYFYPRDQTFGCTREACAFRDHHDQFTAAGADIVGISGDDAASHARFRAEHNLPFDLYSDPTGEVRAAFGVHGPLRARMTFVFDRAGVLGHVCAAQFRFGLHVREALAAAKLFAEPGTAGTSHRRR
jgi:peroxiredoxin Q/BCP